MAINWTEAQISEVVASVLRQVSPAASAPSAADYDAVSYHGRPFVGVFETMPEAIAAAHCGYEILGVTLCANMAAGVLPQPLSGEEVNEMAEQSAPHFSSLILGCLERL